MIDDIEFFYMNAPITDPDVKTLLMHSTDTDSHPQYVISSPIVHRVTINDEQLTWELNSVYAMPEHGAQQPSQQVQHHRPPKQGETGVVVIKGLLGEPAYEMDDGPLADTFLRLKTGSVYQEDGQYFQIAVRQIVVVPPAYASLVVLVRPLS